MKCYVCDVDTGDTSNGVPVHVKCAKPEVTGESSIGLQSSIALRMQQEQEVPTWSEWRVQNPTGVTRDYTEMVVGLLGGRTQIEVPRLYRTLASEFAKRSQEKLRQIAESDLRRAVIEAARQERARIFYKECADACERALLVSQAEGNAQYVYVPLPVEYNSSDDGVMFRVDAKDRTIQFPEDFRQKARGERSTTEAT